MEGDDEEATSVEDDEKTPYLKGAKNKSQSGQPYPIVLGKHFYTPKYIGTPYTTVESDGVTQYYNALYLLGYSKLKIEEISLNQLELSSNPTDITDGYIVVDGVNFSANDVRLEIRQSADCELYPQKVVEEQLSIQLLNADNTPLKVTRFSAQNPQKIQIELGASGLYKLDDSGEKTSTEVRVKAEISYDKGETWLPFARFAGSDSYDASTGTSVFTSILTKERRFVAEYTVPYASIINTDRVAELRIQKVNPDATDSNTADKIYLTGICTWCFEYQKSTDAGSIVPQKPMVDNDMAITARLAMRIKASKDLQGNIDALNCILTSYARTWNGSQWSDVESPTQNPASILLKAYQLPCLRDKAYPDEKLDLEQFGALYTYCEQKN